MPKSKLEQQLVAALKDAKTTVPALQKIRSIAVIQDAPDAKTAMAEGCLLLAVASVNDDEDGDGFRYLMGLPHGVAVSGYLSNFFGRDYAAE